MGGFAPCIMRLYISKYVAGRKGSKGCVIARSSDNGRRPALRSTNHVV